MANETVTGPPQGPAEGGGQTGEPGDPVEDRDGAAGGDRGAGASGAAGGMGDAAAGTYTGARGASTDAGADAGSADTGDDIVQAALALSDSADESQRNPVVRAALAVVRTFAHDMVVFFSVPVREVRTKKLMAIPATLLCVLTIGVLWILEMNRPGGLAFVIDIAGVRQGEPIWQLLPQLPLSLFAPAPDLPAWGAMAQVLIAFGIAECWLGWKKMIAIAMITSAVTSMAARLMVYASNWLHIGTPQIDNFQVDTGPSVAVVSLLIYLALRLRTYWVVALTAVSMGGEAAILPNLAGREHLVAISLGIVTYFLLDRWWPAWRRRRIERATAD